VSTADRTGASCRENAKLTPGLRELPCGPKSACSSHIVFHAATLVFLRNAFVFPFQASGSRPFNPRLPGWELQHLTRFWLSGVTVTFNPRLTGVGTATGLGTFCSGGKLPLQSPANRELQLQIRATHAWQWLRLHSPANRGGNCNDGPAKRRYGYSQPSIPGYPGFRRGQRPKSSGYYSGATSRYRAVQGCRRSGRVPRERPAPSSGDWEGFWAART
jgi:hypothetical protein